MSDLRVPILLWSARITLRSLCSIILRSVSTMASEAFASVFHYLWWAVVNLTAVGYGAVTPVTVGGNVFTFFVLIVGQGDRRS